MRPRCESFSKKLHLRCRRVGMLPAKTDPNAQTRYLVDELEPRLAQAHAEQRAVFCVDVAMKVVTGQLTTRLVESPAKANRQTGVSKTARLQYAFTAHLHDLARTYPTSLNKPVISTIDNAPWHQT